MGGLQVDCWVWGGRVLLFLWLVGYSDAVLGNLDGCRNLGFGCGVGCVGVVWFGWARFAVGWVLWRQAG